MPGIQLKWLDLTSLCNSYLHLIGGGAVVSEIHYFTAYADHLYLKNPSKPQRHRAFVRALTASGVTAHVGKFRKKKVWSDQFNQWIDAYEEKETDVAIACEVLSLAHQGVFDVAVLVTGDSDFAPLYHCFQSHFPALRLLFAFPFARGSKELKQLCPNAFSIGKEAYAKHQFPDRVRLPSSKFVTIPPNWKTSL